MIYNILYKCANLQSYLIWICTFMVVYSHNMCRAHSLKIVKDNLQHSCPHMKQLRYLHWEPKCKRSQSQVEEHACK